MTSPPALISEKELAARMGLKPRTIRTLREKRLIPFVPVPGGYRYPANAADVYLENNTVMPCQDLTQDRVSVSTERAAAFSTSTGPRTAGAVNEARARAISKALKKPSQNSCEDAPGKVVPVTLEQHQ